MPRGKQKLISVLLGLVLCLWPSLVIAQSSSTNYKVDQSFFGTGGELDASSPNYRAKQTAGETAVGNATSPNYQIFAGFNTTDKPYLEFVVTSSNIDLGYLDPNNVKTTTGTFYVRAWLSSGYVVRTESDPPTNASGGHQLTPFATPTASLPGTEQFGINLVKNTNFCGTGCDLGADPQQSPDGTFAFGHAATGYDTSNLFKYNRGDVIAQSDSSSSVTIYTISYIFNINYQTPSGQYVLPHVIVATATY